MNGVALLLLSLTPSLLVFYLLFCIARMNWAGPFDLGIYGALKLAGDRQEFVAGWRAFTLERSQGGGQRHHGYQRPA